MPVALIVSGRSNFRLISAWSNAETSMKNLGETTTNRTSRSNIRLATSAISSEESSSISAAVDLSRE